MAEPRRIGDILGRRVECLVGTDQARAFAAWRRAAGPQVAAMTQPIRLSRGTLTVVCESSVWTNELTYLGVSLLGKLRALDPETPVQRLRFVTGRGGREQGEGPSASK